MVERAFVNAPASRIGTVDAAERRDVMSGSLVAGIYDKTEDRISAHEKLLARSDKQLQSSEAVRPAQGNEDSGGIGGPVGDILSGALGQPKRKGRQRQGVFEAAAKSAARSIGTQIGRTIIRGVLGSLFKR